MGAGDKLLGEHSVFYDYLHDKLKEACVNKRSCVLSWAELKQVLCCRNIPRAYQMRIVNELIDCGMLKRTGFFSFEVLKVDLWGG